MKLPPYEKLGAFYLGRLFDADQGRVTDESYLYDSKDLTTHAVCVGMTGSGKTGLCVTLLEEAAIDGIPAIVLDPKGDLGNLLLTFPRLDAADFRPWLDPSVAAREGESVDDYAESTAARWRRGLADWDQDGARIGRIAILSIAHLGDAERMFFVTLLLNELITWVRAQPGTGSLRALLYMDEVFGYLPPTANPPSKRPLLTLLKQARAYGVGVVLATQISVSNICLAWAPWRVDSQGIAEPSY